MEDMIGYKGNDFTNQNC